MKKLSKAIPENPLGPTLQGIKANVIKRHSVLWSVHSKCSCFGVKKDWIYFFNS